MLRAIDTTFLVEVEIVSHPTNQKAKQFIEQIVRNGDQLAIAPQVISEFIHVVTDPKRFEQPLSMDDAIQAAMKWWNAKESRHIFGDSESTLLQIKWMQQFRLGRRRILDTQFASICYSNGIKSIITTNARDFEIFEVFEILKP